MHLRCQRRPRQGLWGWNKVFLLLLVHAGSIITLAKCYERIILKASLVGQLLISNGGGEISLHSSVHSLRKIASGCFSSLHSLRRTSRSRPADEYAGVLISPCQKPKTTARVVSSFWRRRGDSNSRCRSPHTNDLANRPLQPLGYSSSSSESTTSAGFRVYPKSRLLYIASSPPFSI